MVWWRHVPLLGARLSSEIPVIKRTENEDESTEDWLPGRRIPRGRDALDAARDRPRAPVRRSQQRRIRPERPDHQAGIVADRRSRPGAGDELGLGQQGE